MKVVIGKIVLVAGLAALLMAGCATPQEKQAQTDRDALCAALDTDKDGKITKEEFVARATDKNKAAEIFDKCDSSKKGYLTYDDVWARRTMLPPEISMMTPPGLRGLREEVNYQWSRCRRGAHWVGPKRRPSLP
jgi:Ca2+-binding EF-hand superfamily protein